MALRTIADLPALDVDGVIESGKFENLAESLLEVSYLESPGEGSPRYDTYRSKHVKFRGLSNLMLEGVSN